MLFKSNNFLRSCAVSALIMSMPATANAAGFYIQEQSVSGLGSAFSGSTTNLDDPSTIYFNPAGMTKLSGTQAQLGVHLLVPSSELTDTGSTVPVGAIGGDGGNPYSPSPVPNGYLSHEVGHGFWAGIGISAPFGLANEYDEDYFARFDSIETELTVIDIQPTIAYKVNDQLSIAAGLNFQHSDAKLTSAFYAGVGAEGTSELAGDDWGYGYTLGLLYQPMESTTVGFNYRSTVHHTLDGEVTVEGTGLGPGVDNVTDATAKLATPDVATLGVSHDLDEQWTIMAQATWFGWNNFQDITARNKATGAVIGVPIVQNYQTTWAFALGAEYMYSDEWTFRGGVQLDETPTTDLYRTTRTPDGDRTWLSLGATYDMNESLSLDMAATYIFISDEDINVSRNPLSPSTISADTEGNVGILALGATYKF